MISNLEKYSFTLPEALIAKSPASPRDKAKLLIYNKKSKAISYDFFYNLDKYIPKGSVFVFNQTKVIPARIFLKKETGGKVEILYLKEENNLVEVLADRKLSLGQDLILNGKRIFKVEKQDKNIYFLKSLIPKSAINIFEKHGVMPIPPYIKGTPLSGKELKEKYQSVFAKNIGSSAAPTASLHFTKRLLEKLKRSGHSIKFITLHVGLGTFAPLTEENLKTRKLHKEYYEIDLGTFSFLEKSKKQGKSIIAVGTTVARALESGGLKGETDLFIQEGYKFKMIDGLVTNFHLPKSSLLILVSAFMGRENALRCYDDALHKKLKFYSFGDGMLII